MINMLNSLPDELINKIYRIYYSHNVLIKLINVSTNGGIGLDVQDVINIIDSAFCIACRFNFCNM